MRSLVVSIVAASALLAACGSGATAPVESGSASGDVASAIADCSQGPPAQASLRDDPTKIPDGVVGTLYNETPGEVYVSIGAHFNDMCRLKPGASTVFAGSGWLYGVDLFISRNAEPGERSGTEVTLRDTIAWYPNGAVQGFRFLKPGSNERNMCRSEAGNERDFSEGEEHSYDENALGKLTITRLPDDSDAARKWAGVRDAHVDDWARMDVRIYRVGNCS